MQNASNMGTLLLAVVITSVETAFCASGIGDSEGAVAPFASTC